MDFKVGQYVEYGGAIWQIYTHPKEKIRKDGTSFIAVTLTHPWKWIYKAKYYPRHKMMGVNVKDLKLLDLT